METFIKASAVKTKKEKIGVKRIDAFIKSFNSLIKEGKENGDGSFHLNDGLDKIPTLNYDELIFVKAEAKKRGWNLTQYADSYNSTTYKMIKI